MEITLLHFNALSILLFVIGVFGILNNKKSVIGILIAVEIILLAANINFVSFSAFYEEITGQIFTLFVLGIAAAEIGIGLAILVLYFRSKGDIKIEEINSIKDNL